MSFISLDIPKDMERKDTYFAYFQMRELRLRWVTLAA